jgi:AcrR family transcriptional regulator
MLPPKQQFTKEQILKTAFEILRTEGKDGLTARNIANKLGSSVGPIYSQFSNIEELDEAVMKMGLDLMEDYSKRKWSDIPFLNMGAGFVCFARDEPTLFDICCKGGPTEISSNRLDPRTLGRMRQDEMLMDFSDEDLASIYRKMSIFAYGMAVIASSGSMEDDSNENIVRILMEAGGDIIFMARARSIINDPNQDQERLNELWRYVDEQ